MDRGSKQSKVFRPFVVFVVGNVTFAALFVALLLSAFHQPTPHELPVGLVAPEPAAHDVRAALDASVTQGFDLVPYASEGQAATALRHHEIDAAYVVKGGGAVLMTANADGTALAGVVVATFDHVAAHADQPISVIDLVPPRPGDSDALSLFFVMMGVLFPSLAAGAGSAILFRRSGAIGSIAILVATALLVGLAAAGILDAIAGLGNFAAVAGVAGLFSLAVSSPTALLGRLRPPFVALAVLIFVVLGIPVSGGPGGLANFGAGLLGDLSSVLPLGVAVAAARNTVYFHGFDTVGHVAVLGVWAAGALTALIAVLTVGKRIPYLATSSLDDVELAEFAPLDAALFDPNFD